MSAANKRKEETSHYFHQPGMTQVKRPKLESLVVDGAIDLKRYLRSDVSAKHGKPAPPKNNRERKKSGQNALRQLNYVCLQVPDLQQYLDNHVEVVISHEQMHQAAKHTKKRSIWGTKDYTCDTDLFTALIHQSYLPAAAADSSFAWPDVASQLRVIIKVNPSKASYRASYSNGISSRHWASKCYGCSYRVERCWVVTGSHSCEHVDVELDPVPSDGSLEVVRPFFLAASFDHRMSTRLLAHTGDRRRRGQLDVATFVYSLSNEPWLQYTSTSVADSGFSFYMYTMARFCKEALYLESDSERFELCMLPSSASKANGDKTPKFQLSRCRKPLPQDIMVCKGIPLPADHVQVLLSGVTWEAFQWGAVSLQVESEVDSHGLKVSLKRLHWMAKTHRSPVGSCET